MEERRLVKRRTPAVDKALIVDDDPAYIAFMKKALTHQVRKIVGVTCPLDAIRQVMNDTYDYIFVDIKFRGEPLGLRLIPRLAKYNPLADIIIITAYPEYKEECYELIRKGLASWVWWKGEFYSETLDFMRYVMPIKREIKQTRLYCQGALSG